MSTGKKILTTPLRISIVVLLLGMLARILSWTFAPPIVIIGFSAILVLYALRFWKKYDKQFVDYVKLVLVVFWCINGVFRMLDLPYTLLFQVVICISFITWFILEGTAYFMDVDRRSKNSSLQIWWNIAMVMGTLSIISGSLMKILQWQFATPLLVLGIVIVAAYILKDLFGVTKIKEEDRNNNEEFQL